MVITYEKTSQSFRNTTSLFKFWRTELNFVSLPTTWFWDSEDVCPVFQSQGRSLNLYTSLHTLDGLLSFTSGATSADILAVSMAAEHLLPTYVFKHWWENYRIAWGNRFVNSSIAMTHFWIIAVLCI